MIFHNFQIVNFVLFLKKEHLLRNNQIFHQSPIYHLNKLFLEKVSKDIKKTKHSLDKLLSSKIQLKN